MPLADCGGATTRAAGLSPGLFDAAMKMYFSSSHGTSAFLASRCRRERATRRAKWHQSGSSERASRLMRARCDEMRAGSDQAIAHRQYALPAGRRSRLDDDKRVAGRFP